MQTAERNATGPAPEANREKQQRRWTGRTQRERDDRSVRIGHSRAKAAERSDCVLAAGKGKMFNKPRQFRTYRSAKGGRTDVDTSKNPTQDFPGPAEPNRYFRQLVAKLPDSRHSMRNGREKKPKNIRSTKAAPRGRGATSNWKVCQSGKNTETSGIPCARTGPPPGCHNERSPGRTKQLI